MLDRSEAADIVHDTIRRIVGRGRISNDQQLADLGITGRLQLMQLVASVAETGGLDLASLGDVTGTTLVGDVVDRVMQLAAPKICRGTPPHSQSYPYPPRCGICGARV